MISKAQWESARLRYETDRMVTQEVLAQELGCTRQAVSKKVIKEYRQEGAYRTAVRPKANICNELKSSQSDNLSTFYCSCVDPHVIK